MTPELLGAYRKTQIALKAQAEEYRKELEAKEKQRKEAEEAAKRAEERAASEKRERERIVQQTQYEQKQGVKETQVPPTSYGKS